MRYWREVVIALLAGVIVVLLVMDSRRDAAEPTPEEQVAAADSMRMARSFDSLGYVIFDLSNELHSRTAGVVLYEPLPPRPGPNGRVGQPVPEMPRIPPPTPAQLAAASRSVGATPGRGLSVVIQNTDVQDRAADWFHDNGFTIRSPAEPARKSTNALAYGDSVPWPVVRLAALQLASRGIPLRRVRRSTRPEDARVIRLENLVHLETATPLSPDQVLRLSPRPAAPAAR